MYFPEEDEDNTHYVIDIEYGLEGDYFTEYEVNLMRLVAMHVTDPPVVIEEIDYEMQLAYWQNEYEKELAVKRKLLKRHASEEDEEEAVPAKRRKLNNEKSEEEGEPGISRAGSESEVDENANVEAENEEMTEDV